MQESKETIQAGKWLSGKKQEKAGKGRRSQAVISRA